MLKHAEAEAFAEQRNGCLKREPGNSPNILARRPSCALFVANCPMWDTCGIFRTCQP
jgi:hypothetical protein